jgi:hypothetical protein
MDEEEDAEQRDENVAEPDPRGPACDLHDNEDEEEDDANPPDFTTGTVGVERNLLKNGGVTKMVVKHGEDPSPETPLYGDEVTGQRFPFLPWLSSTIADGRLASLSLNLCALEPKWTMSIDVRGVWLL